MAMLRSRISLRAMKQAVGKSVGKSARKMRLGKTEKGNQEGKREGKTMMRRGKEKKRRGVAFRRISYYFRRDYCTSFNNRDGNNFKTPSKRSFVFFRIFFVFLSPFFSVCFFVFLTLSCVLCVSCVP